MRRAVGVAFMVLGVIGVVVSLLMLPATWVGRNVANDYVTALADGVTAPLTRAEAATAEVSADLEAMRVRLRQTADQAESAAQSGQLEQQAAERMLAALNEAVDVDLPRVREALVAGRERVTAALEARERIRRLFGFLPFAPLGDDELGPIATEVAQLQATLRETRARLQASAPVSALAQQVASALRQIDGRLDTLATRIDTVEGRLDQAQVSIDQAESNINGILNLAMLALMLLFLYIALLHAVLFTTGRSMWRAPVAAPVARAPLDVGSTA